MLLLSAQLCSRSAADPGGEDGERWRLFATVVAAGGGSGHFTATELAEYLGGPAAHAAASESVRRFDAAAVVRTAGTIDFAVADTLRVAAARGVRIPVVPPPDSGGGSALAAALYAAGGGSTTQPFRARAMFARLVPPPFGERVGRDVAVRFGTGAAARSEAVLTVFMRALAGETGLAGRKQASHTARAWLAVHSFRASQPLETGYDDSSFGGSCGLKKSRPPSPVNVCAQMCLQQFFHRNGERFTRFGG